MTKWIKAVAIFIWTFLLSGIPINLIPHAANPAHALSGAPLVLTAVASPSTTMQMNVPLFGDVVDIFIDWGDGSVSGPFNSSDNTAGEISHQYATSGTYTLSVSGTHLSHFGTYCSSTTALSAVQSFGDLGITDLSYAFCGASKLTSVPSALPQGVTNLEAMFLYADSFNQDISSWDTSAVTRMVAMFRSASAFNNGSATNDGQHPLGAWDTSQVTNFGEMFMQAGAFNQDISGWNLTSATSTNVMFNGAQLFNNGSTGAGDPKPMTASSQHWQMNNLQNAGGMFSGASSFNQDIGNWNLSSVTNLDSMFDQASAFNQDISAWRFPNAVSLNWLFANASAFNNGGQPLTWDVSNIQYLGATFAGATSFNSDISDWDVSSVANLGSTFSGAISFNQNLNEWDTSNVSYFGGTFSYASAFNNGSSTNDGRNAMTWDTSNGTSLGSMFCGASSFNQNISSWNTSKVTDTTTMFINATSFNNGSITNDNLHPLRTSGALWDMSKVVNNYRMFYSASSFNQDIGNWDISSVNQMWGIFTGATSFNQNLGGWTLSTSLNNAQEMFENTSMSVANYDALLNGWSAQATNQFVYFSSDLNYSSAGQAARNALINNRGWTIIDRGLFSSSTPTVSTWPSAADIRYRDRLSSSGLTGGQASVPGTFTFEDGTLLPEVGQANHNVVFTPDDSAHYLPVTSSVSVRVNKALPNVLQWPTLVGITEGQTLSSSGLNGGQTNVIGSFEFQDYSFIPALGDSNVTVIFRPQDAAHYDELTQQISINVAVAPTPSPSATPSSSPTSSVSPSPSPSETVSPSPSPSESVSPSPTPDVTETASPEPTPTPEESVVALSDPSESPTPSPSPSESVSPTPEMTESAAPEPEPSPTVDERGLTIIDPLQDAPQNVVNTTVAAVTLVAAVSAAAAASSAIAAATSAGSAASGMASAGASTGGATTGTSSNSGSTSGSRSKSEHSGDHDSEHEFMDLKKVRASGGQQALQESVRWGDNLPLWSSAALIALDRPTKVAAQGVSRYSPITSKLVSDGAYIRAMLGSFSGLLVLAASALGIVAAGQANGLLLPPAVGVLSALVVIGVLDAGAGIIGFAAFSVGMVFTAGIHSASDVRMLMGVGLLCFAPGMLGVAFRNLRRPASQTGQHWYERVSDLMIAPLLAGWTAKSVVSALPALSGVELEISAYATRIGIVAAVAMVLRVALEELCAQLFPGRLSVVHPSSVAAPSMMQKVISLCLRAGLFFFVALAFVGNCWQLWVGTIIFIVPSFLGLLRDQFPNFPKLFQVLPSGLFGLAISLFLAKLTMGFVSDTLGKTPSFALMAFVLVPIPGFILSMAALFGRTPQPGDVRWYLRPRNQLIYVFGGIAVLVWTLFLTEIL